jgi:tRNA threonylcarbamoyladenosine biosynthesis protein TsaE
MQTFVTNSFDQTQHIAEEFAKTLKGGTLCCLYGELGYGKTTFIQGLARGLGIEKKIISPTFIIMRSYTISGNESGINHFYHVDLYRINHEQEIIDLGLPDFIKDPQNVVAIEWPGKMGKLLPDKRIDIRLEYLDEDKRSITINN